MIRYNRLFAVLNAKGMKKTDLLAVRSSPTLAKLSKGEPVRTDVIDRICLFLGCEPENIMEVPAEPAPVDAEEPKAVEEYVAEKNGTQIESVLRERFNYHLSKFSFGGLPAVDLFEHYLFLREVGVIAEKCGFSELVEKIAEYLPEKEDE